MSVNKQCSSIGEFNPDLFLTMSQYFFNYLAFEHFSRSFRFLLKIHNVRLERLVRSLHRIVAARMKRMAAKQASHTHQAAAHRAVAFNRFACIFGASRNKSARRRQPRRDYSLIELQERNKYDAHR